MSIIGVGDDVALVGAVVHALAEGVRYTKHDVLCEAAIPCHLQRVVTGTGDVVRLTNGVVALEWAQSIQVDGRVHSASRSHNVRSWLVDVRLTLLVQTAAADIRDTEHGFQPDLPLDGEVPVPGLGILEITALRRYCQRKAVGRVPTWVIGAA